METVLLVGVAGIIGVLLGVQLVGSRPPQVMVVQVRPEEQERRGGGLLLLVILLVIVGSVVTGGVGPGVP